VSPSVSADRPPPPAPPTEALGSDVDRAVLVWFLALAAGSIALFALLRALRGEWVAMGVDLLIAAAIASVAVAARRARALERVGTVGTLVCAAGCLVGTIAIGRTGLYWAFIVLWVSFLFAPVRRALLIDAPFVLALTLMPGLYANAIERLSFLVTAALSMVFGALFAQRYRNQRQSLALLASYDALTGAGSRRLFELRAGRSELRSPAVLAVLDLDRFKEANDTLGHEAGDRLLSALGRIVRARIRKTDEFFRYGGDEFVLVLPGLAAERAGPLLEDLRERIRFALAEAGWPCTVSIGATQLRAGETVISAFPRADQALRRAKEAGRDRIAFADEAAGHSG
jgi:diguanylate cyclase (GGDEF)-like protein